MFCVQYAKEMQKIIDYQIIFVIDHDLGQTHCGI